MGVSANSVIDFCANLQPGSHLCQFYKNSREYFEVLVPFFQAGLKANEFCFWVVPNRIQKIAAYKALNKVVPKLDHYLKKGQLEIVPRAEWYQGQVAGFHKELSGWLKLLEQRAQSFDAIRGSGNVNWLKKSEWDDFIRYENLFDELAPGTKLISVCSYPVKNLEPSEVVDVAHAHPYTLIKKKNEWIVTQSGIQKRTDAAKRRSDARLHAAIECLPFDFWLRDENKRMVMLNTVARKNWGEHILGKLVDECGYSDEVLANAKSIHDKVYSGETFQEEREYEIHGEKRILQSIIAPVKEGNQILGALGVNVDVTSLKNSEARLMKTEAKYHRIFDQAQDGIFQCTPEGKYISANPALARMLGYDSPQSLIQEVSDIATQIYVIPEQRKIWKKIVDQKGMVRDVQQEVYRKDGSRIWISFNARAVRDEENKLLYYEGSIQDITERKRAEEERKELLLQLKKKNEHLEMLSRQIVSIQEKERRHIAHELHDEIGQLLTGIRLKLESAAILPSDQIPNVIKETDAFVEELIQRVRELSLELCPAILDDLGLLPAVLWHLERFTNQSGIPVDFKHSQIQDIRFRQDVETAAYRILQEALTNVMRHAGHCEVQVKIWIVTNILNLEIHDNGKGFDLNSISNKNASFGLSGMQERAVVLRGKLIVKSAPRKGTSISVQLPLKPDRL